MAVRVLADEDPTIRPSANRTDHERSPASARSSIDPSGLEADAKLYEHLLSVTEEAFGPDHPDVGAACHMLAVVYIAQARYEQAEVLLYRALGIAERVSGTDDPDVASIIEDLARVDDDLGRDLAAEILLRRALAIRERALPADHPDLISTASRLGMLSCRLRHFAAAESLLRTVATWWLVRPGAPSSEAVVALSTLGVALAGRGLNPQAEEELSRARDVADALFDRVTPVPSLSVALPVRTGAPVAMSVLLGRSAELVDKTEPGTIRGWRAQYARARLRTQALAHLAMSSTARLIYGAERAWEARDGRLIDKATHDRPIAGAPDGVSARPGEEAISASAPHETTIRLPAEMSAARTLDSRQRLILLVVGIGLTSAALVDVVATAVALIAIATAVYLAAVSYRTYVFARSVRSAGVVRVSDTEARALEDSDLPAYTILVPAYREPEIVGRLIDALGAIEYPTDRLEIKLLLEADDHATIAAALAANPPNYMEVVRVPYSEPRTKPRALNYGLKIARGELLTIYDAEDRPDPLQLRRAAAAFRALGASVACLQARLSYYNVKQNLITKWFTSEYAMWFGYLLPGLVERGAPLPLGGTSNHFRRSVLESVGAWDSYNVTEDADLGIRLHRTGYRTRVLDSTTLEEANSDFINWAKQRSRWYKGYMQTWLVHMRHPRRLLSDLGVRGFLGFHLFVGGTPVLAALNPVFWGLMMLWVLGQRTLLATLFPTWIYYLAAFSLFFGNFAIFYKSMISARATSPELIFSALLAPAYWAMMSVAAVKALLQLVIAPSFWEKTVHGLDRSAPAEAIQATRSSA